MILIVLNKKALDFIKQLCEMANAAVLLVHFYIILSKKELICPFLPILMFAKFYFLIQKLIILILKIP